MNIGSPEIDLAGLSAASSYISAIAVVVLLLRNKKAGRTPKQTLTKLCAAIFLISSFFVCSFIWLRTASDATVHYKVPLSLVTVHTFAPFVISALFYWLLSKGKLAERLTKKLLLIIGIFLLSYFCLSPAILFSPFDSTF
ncbi:MAG: hypothetical protein R3E13_10280 [Alphaproteobacteria bacterium]